MLVVVIEFSITYFETDKYHIDKHKQCRNSCKQTDGQTHTGYQFKTFSQVCHEQREWQFLNHVPFGIFFNWFARVVLKKIVCSSVYFKASSFSFSFSKKLVLSPMAFVCHCSKAQLLLYCQLILIIIKS